MNVYGGRTLGTGRRLIYVERASDINTNVGPPTARLQPVPPGPNYAFRRYGSLNVFTPLLNIPIVPDTVYGGAVAETAPPFLGSPPQAPPLPEVRPQGQTPGLVVPEETPISSESPEYLRVNGALSRDNLYGRFTPLFGGRVVLGAGKRAFLAALVMYASLIGNTAFMQGPLEKYCGGFPVYVTGIVLGILTLCTFLLYGTADPGVVPKNHSLRELLSETEEYRAAHPNEKYFLYCNDCRTCRPPRTFHCRACDICIRGQDVHLRHSQTCVGEGNRRPYFLHLIIQTLYGAYLFATSVMITIRMIRESRTDPREIIQLIFSAIGGILLLFYLDFGSLFMLIFEIYLIVRGRTCREWIRKKFHFGLYDCFVERLPVWQNVRNFFCQKSRPSAFRRGNRLSQIDPESARIGVGMPDAWILDQWPPRQRPSVEFREMRDHFETRIQNFEDDIANANITNAQLLGESSTSSE